MHTSCLTASRTATAQSAAAKFAYAAAVLFAAHLATDFIPAIRDVTVTHSVVGAVLLAVLAVDFACYAFIAQVSPRAFIVAMPSLVLLPLWFVLASRRVTRMGWFATRAVHVTTAISAQ